VPPFVSHKTTHSAPFSNAASMHLYENSGFDLKPSKKCSQSIRGSLSFAFTDKTESLIASMFLL